MNVLQVKQCLINFNPLDISPGRFVLHLIFDNYSQPFRPPKWPKTSQPANRSGPQQKAPRQRCSVLAALSASRVEYPPHRVYPNLRESSE